MQTSPANLHVQLRHSTAVLDGFIPDVNTMKKESSALTKSVDSLAKDYIKQCKRLATPPAAANPVLEKLEVLANCSRVVHEKAANLKVCLDAVVNRTYKPDLQRADKGKSTKTLVDAQQEANTFETHIRLAESLVASVLPHHEATNCYRALNLDHLPGGDLHSAFEATRDLIPSGAHTPLLGNVRIETLRSAAVHLRNQIEAPGVRQRVQPYSRH
ncbi:MAG TPA: hypothetical protein VFV28_10215 [Limnobacter sp.]|nr:hypothetical protein [Limnobacter sp.]